MRRLLFDIEGDGLLPELTRVHCIAAVDPDTGWRGDWGPDEIPAALSVLESADQLWAHFGLGYDFPALAKVHDFRVPLEKQRDTVVAARLIKPNIKETDGDLVQQGKLPGEFHGSHKLKAWGYRLGEHKADYEGPWDTWSPTMQSYMVQDVSTMLALFHHLGIDAYSQPAIELEHLIFYVCERITEAGWPLDERAGGELHSVLTGEQERIGRELIAEFGSWYATKGPSSPEALVALAAAKVKHVGGGLFLPKRDNAKLGYVAGAPCTKLERVTFNPASRPHIFRGLQQMGWKPRTFTAGGQPKVDETILLDVAGAYPAASKLVRFLMLEKRLGQLSDGDGAWLKLVKNGRIHASYNAMGTVTGRASHYRPNIAQVPAIKDRKGRVQPFGAECRALFYVPPGWSQIGADMASLELRCLAHYLARHDDGEYARIVCEGDVHTFNQEAAGLPDRQMAKTFIYAWLYGAGDAKIGAIVNGNAKRGSELKFNFMKRIPAVAKLKQRIGGIVDKHHIVPALDGRLIPVRSEHSAINFLLQGAGAILCKRWVADSYFKLLSLGLRHGWDGDFVFLGWIHDEIQVAVREGLEEQVAAVLVACARAAGEPFGFRCPLDSDYKVGRNWRDTH